jgi:hypothetical protein
LIPATTPGSVLSVSDEAELVPIYRYEPIKLSENGHVLRFDVRMVPMTAEDRLSVLVAIARARRATLPDLTGEPLVSYELSETNEAFFYQYGVQSIADQDGSLG